MSDDGDVVLDVRSDICWSDETSVTVLGRDLCTELIGTIDFGGFAFLLLTGREPSEAEGRLFNAALVSLVEHGMTPNSMATRLTHLGAPESLQSAVAAGLLGLGDRFVGTIQGAAETVAEIVERVGGATDDGPTDDELAEAAASAVAGLRDAGRHVPGIGHPIHTPVDPRAEALFALAERLGFAPLPIAAMRAVSAQASRATGRALPVNVTGAIGTIAVLLGIDPRIARGLGVVSRAVGLVGHLREEADRPMATTLWRATDESATRALRDAARGAGT